MAKAFASTPFASTLLGGLSPDTFLRRHWQRNPRLIQGAFPGFKDLVSPDDLVKLACKEDCRSRLVLKQGRQWEVRHGPFSIRELLRLPGRGWALLVQDVNLVLRSAHDLLMQFRFIPYARMDDLMISLAPDGGGVGPHFDSYDVFLLQGHGQRRWQWSTQTDLALLDNAPLRILKKFRAEEEHVLNPGDMLYLPPGVAHRGVAMGQCMTYSIGFRSPSFQELASGFLTDLEDHLSIEGIYRDPAMRPANAPAEIPLKMIEDARSHIAKLDTSRARVVKFLGRHLTEPKPQVVFAPPTRPLSRSKFATALKLHGAELDLRARMLWYQNHVFINGEHLEHTAGTHLAELANSRGLAPGITVDSATLDKLHDWYRAGYLLVKSS
ncbi:MAG: cupin domain-containing protein [Betaproteobacteria bacterium]|nr:cupin domain-containing protein [Betaproteobacteria bacterium]